MKKVFILAALCALFLLSACSAPRINILDSTEDPLREFTLEGKGKEKNKKVSIIKHPLVNHNLIFSNSTIVFLPSFIFLSPIGVFPYNMTGAHAWIYIS